MLTTRKRSLRRRVLRLLQHMLDMGVAGTLLQSKRWMLGSCVVYLEKTWQQRANAYQTRQMGPEMQSITPSERPPCNHPTDHVGCRAARRLHSRRCRGIIPCKGDNRGRSWESGARPGPATRRCHAANACLSIVEQVQGGAGGFESLRALRRGGPFGLAKSDLAVQGVALAGARYMDDGQLCSRPQLRSRPPVLA